MKASKMKGGVDIGPCHNYWRLSYRRKFIRTLWMVPFAIAVVLGAVAFNWRPLGIPPWAFAVLFTFMFVAQVGYNYVRWKAE